MLKKAKSASFSGDKNSYRKDAGAEFADTIFGRDRQLEATEKWTAMVRLWSMRFDANCTPILQKPMM